MSMAGQPAPGFGCVSSLAIRYGAVLPATRITFVDSPSLTFWQDRMSNEQIDALVINFQEKGYVRELAELFWDTQAQRA